MKDKIFNPILNYYLKLKTRSCIQTKFRKNNFWWTHDLWSLIFLQKYFVNCLSFKMHFQNTTFVFFLYEFCGCNPLKTLRRQNSSTMGNLEVYRLVAHAQCNRVTCKSGVITFVVQFFFSCFAQDEQKISMGV